MMSSWTYRGQACVTISIVFRDLYIPLDGAAVFAANVALLVMISMRHIYSIRVAPYADSRVCNHSMRRQSLGADQKDAK